MSEEETTTQLEEKAIDSPHPLYIPLWRIAVALEEQNRFNWQWLEQNKTWQKENNERDIGPRLVEIHEENAARDQSYREEMTCLAEKNARKVNETIEESYAAFLSSLKEPPSKELVQAVGEALANHVRRSTGIREREGKGSHDRTDDER